jgi:hypothetical protein
MKMRKLVFSVALIACSALFRQVAGGQAAIAAQDSAGAPLQPAWARIGAAYQQLHSNNATMSEVQPTWMAPITQADARLGQGLRFSVSQSSWPAARTIAYGNNHGMSLIAGRRLQFELVPPSFFRNHSAVTADGWGNAAVEAKARIASGNAARGNYIVTAILYHGFAPRAGQNHAMTGVYKPALAGGRMFGRVALLSSLGGCLPTGKIAQQGRGIEWKGTAEFHASAHAWFDIENSALFLRGGPFDGKTQNFIAPGAFYALRRAEWKPNHAAVVLDCGIQTATSHFHFYNHNLVTEIRLVF